MRTIAKILRHNRLGLHGVWWKSNQSTHRRFFSIKNLKTKIKIGKKFLKVQ